MTEIFVGSTADDRKIYLNSSVTPVEDTLIARLKSDTGDILHTPTVGTDDAGHYITVPYSLAKSERLLTLEWEFDYEEDGIPYEEVNSVRFNVVRPILSVEEVLSIATGLSRDEAIALERKVRHIIYAHTGQAFGLFIGQKTVPGDGSNTLTLPAKLLEVKTISGQFYDPALYTISGSGWYLTLPNMGIPNVKADFYGLHEINGQVTNPNMVNPAWINKGPFTINGLWGWYEVPEAIKEAARLLVNDYACGDSIYRERYIQGMSSSDWRIDFHSGAFQQTGNVLADQLLSNYVLKRGWAAV